jgi:hypothetical protein
MRKLLARIRGVVVTAAFLASPAFGCSCIDMGVKSDMAAAALVFRGTVTDIKVLPSRKEVGDRRRYTATFSASEYWKGAPAKSVLLHLVDPRPDCIGARFDLGKEYVVFAVAQRAKDYRLGDDLWYGWLDILADGLEILTVNNFCNSTAEVKAAAQTLKQLGQGRAFR